MEQKSNPNKIKRRYEDYVTYTCPVRGVVTELVTVTEYESAVPSTSIGLPFEEDSIIDTIGSTIPDADDSIH